jgi:hypothetical protein
VSKKNTTPRIKTRKKKNDLRIPCEVMKKHTQDAKTREREHMSGMLGRKEAKNK